MPRTEEFENEERLTWEQARQLGVDPLPVDADVDPSDTAWT